MKFKLPDVLAGTTGYLSPSDCAKFWRRDCRIRTNLSGLQPYVLGCDGSVPFAGDYCGAIDD